MYMDLHTTLGLITLQFISPTQISLNSNPTHPSDYRIPIPWPHSMQILHFPWNFSSIPAPIISISKIYFAFSFSSSVCHLYPLAKLSHNLLTIAAIGLFQPYTAAKPLFSKCQTDEDISMRKSLRGLFLQLLCTPHAFSWLSLYWMYCGVVSSMLFSSYLCPFIYSNHTSISSLSGTPQGFCICFFLLSRMLFPFSLYC